MGLGCPELYVKKFLDSKKTIERNTKRMEAARNSVKQFQEKLSSARYELFQAKTMKFTHCAATVPHLLQKLKRSFIDTYNIPKFL